ncbi:MAG: hypothetical protein IH897_06350 [Planctomycetes bacterium]|nr:hypothetical protein [Planctomycetota bacterium]
MDADARGSVLRARLAPAIGLKLLTPALGRAGIAMTPLVLAAWTFAFIRRCRPAAA